MDGNNIFISIVIPVYNEENRIKSFLSSVTDYLIKKDFTYEIVIVDDGSIDSTIKTIETLLKEKLPGKYRIIILPENMGKGGAVRKGMLEARGEYIFFIDADGSTSITEIDNFIKHFNPEFDIYIGKRKVKKETPFKRIFFGYGYTIIANCLLQLRIFDYTCGFKCYKNSCAKKIFSKQTLNNWSFDSEDIFIAKVNGYRIKPIEVEWKHTPGSNVRVLNSIYNCAIDLFRIRVNNIKGMYS